MRRELHIRGCAIALIANAALCGCSAAMTRVDAQWSGRTAPACDSGLAPPIVDALIGASGVAVGVLEVDKPDKQMRPAVAATGFAAALLFTIFSVSGSNIAAECSAARVAWRAGGHAPTQDTPAGADVESDLDIAAPKVSR